MFAWRMPRPVIAFGPFSGLPLVGLGSFAVQGSIRKVDKHKYGYDVFGNVAWKENVVAHDAGEYLDEMYTYDSTGQLTGKAGGLLNENCNGFESGTESSSQSWTLDALGNWIRANGATTDSTYNSSNENTAYTYDHAGNLTDDGTYT